MWWYCITAFLRRKKKINLIEALQPVRLTDGCLQILDQRQLPAKEVWINLEKPEQVFEAIRSLAVRGAPAIGICAAYGVAVCTQQEARHIEGKALSQAALKICDYLAQSRPTAVNLFFVLDQARELITLSDPALLVQILMDWAQSLHRRDLEDSRNMARAGLEVIPAGARILTHCNTGALATGGGGTALGLIVAAWEAGLLKQVWVDETRPLLQGARLTAWELQRLSVPFRLITDSMAGVLMGQGEVDLVLVGADRIAGNGDFANKIGTYSLGVLARYHGVPFYTVAPLSSFDFTIPDGRAIPIEERDPEEVRAFAGSYTAPEQAAVYNPAFDVTPGTLLSGIICEKGLIRPPLTEAMVKINKED